MAETITVLLIEDDEITADLFNKKLNRRGFQVLHTADAQTGIEMAQSSDHSIDVVLMDFSLSGDMDGKSAAKKLKADPQTSALPIIAISAHIDYKEKKDLDSIFDGTCLKPVDFNRLFRTILNLVQSRHNQTAG